MVIKIINLYEVIKNTSSLCCRYFTQSVGSYATATETHSPEEEEATKKGQRSANEETSQEAQ